MVEVGWQPDTAVNASKATPATEKRIVKPCKDCCCHRRRRQGKITENYRREFSGVQSEFQLSISFIVRNPCEFYCLHSLQGFDYFDLVSLNGNHHLASQISLYFHQFGDNQDKPSDSAGKCQILISKVAAKKQVVDDG